MKSAGPVAFVAFMLLGAAGGRAEQRYRPAPPAPPPAPVVPPALSTGGITTLPPPPPPSPFAARPGTYAPHYTDPAPRSRGYGYGVPYYNGAVGIGSYVIPAAAAPAPEQKPPSTAPEPSPVPEPVPVPEPPRIAAAHGPDMFYVIPGCYAGNRPPNPARLPKGCDVARMRVTPIR